MESENLIQNLFEKMKIEMTNQTKEIILKIDEKLQPLITEIKELKAENNNLREKLAITEKLKRKNNIIIHGFIENETSSSELMETIIGKMKTDLNISLEKRDIDIIYRLGKKDNKQTKPRPILITLVNGWKKSEIILNKKKYKDGFISEDYPKDVLMKRKELQKELIQERSKGNFAVIKYDKLIVTENKGTSNIEKRKREQSMSPSNSQQPRKQFVPPNTNRLNAFDLMRGRSNSLSSFLPSSESST